MYTPHQRRITSLEWPDLRRLLEALALEPAEFNQQWAPAEWLSTLEELANSAEITPDRIDTKLCDLFEVTDLNDLDRKLLKRSVTVASKQIAVAVLPYGSRQAIDQIVLQIDSIRAAKAIHAEVQHQIGFKLIGCLLLAKALATDPSVLPSARQTVRSIFEDLAKVKWQTAYLRLPVYRLEMEQANDEVLSVVQGLLNSLQPGAVVDMLTPLKISLKNYVAQIPSNMQRLLALESTSIPWSELSKLTAPAGGAVGNGSQSFSAIENQLNELVVEHSQWQTIHNKIALVGDRLDAFFAKAAGAATEINYILNGIINLPGSLPVATQCQPLASLLANSITSQPDAEIQIRYQMENLEAFANSAFNTADNKLLVACGDLDKMSDSLKIQLTQMP